MCKIVAIIRVCTEHVSENQKPTITIEFPVDEPNVRLLAGAFVDAPEAMEMIKMLAQAKMGARIYENTDFTKGEN